MERIKIVIRIRIILFLVLVPGILSAATWVDAADYLTGSGCSVSNVGYLRELAKEYERRTGVKVFVRGGGSVVGIEDLRTGKVDFAAACRTREENDPGDITFTQVAWDVLVFIVHKTNRIDDISLDSARSIYAGKITSWNQLKGNDRQIRVFISHPKRGLSGVEASLINLVLKGSRPVETPNTSFVASTGIVEQMVEDTPDGFATSGYSSSRKRDVKMLSVNGVAPTLQNIVVGRYPLKRPLFLLTSAKPKPEVRAFVAFVLSKAGQDFIRSQGVVPLSAIK